ncbi:hypothetical protein PQX77_006222 [Marasmius sp. AFHP31]|nr:hypothetical protein PQX77_006222 [Marasmius sp. AFHP31]
MSPPAQTAEQERGVSNSVTEAEIQLINDLMKDLPEEEQKNCLRVINRHKKNCLDELTRLVKRERKVAPPPDSVSPEARHATTEARESTLEPGSSPTFINTSRQTSPCDPNNLSSPMAAPPCGIQRPDSRKNRYVHRFDPYTQRSKGGRAVPMTTVFVPQHRPHPGVFTPRQQYPGQQGTTAAHQRQVPVMPQPAPSQSYTHQQMRQPNIFADNVRSSSQQPANSMPPPPLTPVPTHLQPEVQARLLTHPQVSVYPLHSQQNVYQQIVIVNQIQPARAGAMAQVNPYN